MDRSAWVEFLSQERIDLMPEDSLSIIGLFFGASHWRLCRAVRNATPRAAAHCSSSPPRECHRNRKPWPAVIPIPAMHYVWRVICCVIHSLVHLLSSLKGQLHSPRTYGQPTRLARSGLNFSVCGCLRSTLCFTIGKCSFSEPEDAQKTTVFGLIFHSLDSALALPGRVLRNWR